MLTLEERAQHHYPNSEHNQQAWLRSVEFLGDKWKLADRRHRPTPDMMINPFSHLDRIEDDLHFDLLISCILNDVFVFLVVVVCLLTIVSI